MSWASPKGVSPPSVPECARRRRFATFGANQTGRRVREMASRGRVNAGGSVFGSGGWVGAGAEERADDPRAAEPRGVREEGLRSLDADVSDRVPRVSSSLDVQEVVQGELREAHEAKLVGGVVLDARQEVLDLRGRHGTTRRARLDEELRATAEFAPQAFARRHRDPGEEREGAGVSKPRETTRSSPLRSPPPRRAWTHPVHRRGRPARRRAMDPRAEA